MKFLVMSFTNTYDTIKEYFTVNKKDVKKIVYKILSKI